jgi:signal transduction histidine kinase
MQAFHYLLIKSTISASLHLAFCCSSLMNLYRKRILFLSALQKYLSRPIHASLTCKKQKRRPEEAQVELSLERIRSKVTAMQESSELLDIVVAMRNEFVALGHEAHYFWHMRWLPEKYEKAMTSGDGSRIGMVMQLPRHIHGDIKLVADWEKSDESTVVLAMDTETAIDYVHKMITLGDFELVDHNAPTLDDIRHIGGLTFIMARTTHGEIGYSLPGCVTDPPTEGIATLARFAGVFDLAFKRFEDLKAAERDLIAIKAARLKAEEALAVLQATQKQLIQSEKMASLGELTAGIAHEIQNPLNFVNNFSEVNFELIDELITELTTGNVQEAIVIADDIKENEQKISHHGKRADAIVKGMLQHSRVDSGKKELTDINALADEYLRLSYHGLRAKDKTFNSVLETYFDPSIKSINIVPQEIGRVLLNLLNNAFYAVHEKKKISDSNYEPTVSVSTVVNDHQVSIKIKDNGNGIPQKVLDKIFQPFFTTKPTGEGTGLGLSLSYDILKAHGGELKVETTEYEGALFTIQIPIT